ncbi:03393824-ae24-42c5-a717-d8b278055239 [Sclerotinia trifoliorum]|uniref:03393824-ae24-42c5-a717-d8b278055239 n=1 Tax=Sclerotinia trifoliorum TaxID=28548 RepID=A0A8H2VRW1_9HELO|nr:03393824-ae24-42c5-a717-d8b278055239 [Sclerotinia trifoliorum]
MCYQVIRLFECGHHSPSIDVPCNQPSKNCGGVFLRQEIEDTKGLCERCQEATEMRKTVAEPEDEGYWS